MIEYKRMVRTMRRRVLLLLLLVVVLVGFWQSPPIPVDGLLRSFTPDSARTYYEYQGAAQTLSVEIEATQRRFDWHLKRAELKPIARNPIPVPGMFATGRQHSKAAHGNY